MRRRRPWFRRLINPFVGRRGFTRDETGAVAVEFGILALPFFTLIYAILETSLVFFAGQILDSAVHDATRKIRTGQAQSPAPPATAWDIEDFRTAVCGGLYGMFDCDQLRVRVEVVDNFTSAYISDPMQPDCEEDATEEELEECGDWAIQEAYDGGIGSDVILVRVLYLWPTIVNLPGLNLATEEGGKRLLSAARVFRNEPF